MGVFTSAITSAWRWAGLVVSGRTRLNYDRIHKSYAIDESGTYTVFRQTDSVDSAVGKPVVLVVGFRLKLVGNSRVGHWLFERVCILTTPIWSGFRGFRVKLWMVNRQTKNYLGIYKWANAENAEDYAAYLTKVLNFFSVPGSVWHHTYPVDFGVYLQQHATAR